MNPRRVVHYHSSERKEKSKKTKNKKEVNFLDHHKKAIVKSQVGSQETLIKGNIQSFSIRTSTKKKKK